MDKTINDIYEILSDILFILKESNNNQLKTFDIDESADNNLITKLDLNVLDNAIIKSIDGNITNQSNILTGKGKIKISWKE